VAREALRIAGDPRRLLDDAAHGAPVELAQGLLPRQGADEAGIERVGLGTALDMILQVRGDLEELRELRIELAEQVIDPSLAQKEDLGVQRDWLGLQRTVLMRLATWARDSMRISPEESTRLRVSQAKGCIRSFRASTIRYPPLARCSAPQRIMVKSVSRAPMWARCSMRPMRLL
jgi:hypothetical protein